MINLDKLKTELLGDWETAKRNLVFGNAIGANTAPRAPVETTALTLIGPRLLDEFRTLIERAVHEHIPGDIVEAGVWAGGACIWAAAVLDNLGSPKKVYVCDSFAGLPTATHPKETLEFTEPTLTVPLERVMENFDRFGLLERAVFVRGWFKDTMPRLKTPVAVLRLDGDLYESTNDVLRALYPKVSRGGFVIVDDYQLPSCKQAVDELRSRERIRGSLPNRAGAWWQK